MTVRPETLLNTELLDLTYHKNLPTPQNSTEKGSVMSNVMCRF